MMKEYQGFKVQDQGSSRWTVSLRRVVGMLKTVASKAAAERAVKGWIDDRQLKPPPKGSAMIAALARFYPGWASRQRDG
jgi:hypothetical protein